MAESGNEIERRWVADRSAMPIAPEIQTVAATPSGTTGVPLPDLRRTGRDCWFLYKDESCGCSGVKCHLKGGRMVTIYDCSPCEWSEKR